MLGCVFWGRMFLTFKQCENIKLNIINYFLSQQNTQTLTEITALV